MCILYTYSNLKFMLKLNGYMCTNDFRHSVGNSNSRIDRTTKNSTENISIEEKNIGNNIQATLGKHTQNKIT